MVKFINVTPGLRLIEPSFMEIRQATSGSIGCGTRSAVRYSIGEVPLDLRSISSDRLS